MNSKETLEQIKDFWLDHDGDDGVYEVKQEAFDVISKDLEMLEFIIKNYGELISKRLAQKIKRLDDLIDTYEKYRFSPIDSYKESRNKLLKVKEWLDNEQI